jgi:hypothetical protein
MMTDPNVVAVPVDADFRTRTPMEEAMIRGLVNIVYTPTGVLWSKDRGVTWHRDVDLGGDCDGLDGADQIRAQWDGMPLRWTIAEIDARALAEQLWFQDRRRKASSAVHTSTATSPRTAEQLRKEVDAMPPRSRVLHFDDTAGADGTGAKSGIMIEVPAEGWPEGWHGCRCGCGQMERDRDAGEYDRVPNTEPGRRAAWVLEGAP